MGNCLSSDKTVLSDLKSVELPGKYKASEWNYLCEGHTHLLCYYEGSNPELKNKALRFLKKDIDAKEIVDPKKKLEETINFRLNKIYHETIFYTDKQLKDLFVKPVIFISFSIQF